MNVHRKKVWIAICLGLALLVSACAKTEPPPTTPDPKPAETPPPKTEPPPPPPPQEQVVVWGRGGDSILLDPIHVTDGESLRVTDQMFEGLVGFTPGTTEVMPALAKEWSANAEGTEWTFKLQEGVKFHDGTDFDAEAAKYNLDRWRLTSHPEHRGGDFLYFPDQFNGFDDECVIQDVEVVDKYTLKIILRNPQAPFLQNLAMSPFGMGSPQAIKANPDAFAVSPVGTGAFKFGSWDKGDKIVLDANADYWGGAPAVDKLIYRSIPDNNARLIALQSGELDLMDGIDPAHVPIIEGLADFDVVYRPANTVGYLAFNMDRPPFDKLEVRQAINHAINKEAIVKAFFGTMGEPAVTPLPPAMWGKTFDVTTYDYNPEKAKELLAAAGFPDGFKTELWAMPVPRPYMPKPTDIAVALLGDLKAIGIEASITSYDWGTYLAKTREGEHPMALLGWTGDNGDPDNFLYVLLDKDSAKKGTASNISFYRSDALHDVLIEAQRTIGQDKRAPLYVEAQKIIAADAPWAPLVHSTVPIAVRKTISGFTPSPMSQEILSSLKIDN